jgi:hypothetical protein
LKVQVVYHNWKIYGPYTRDDGRKHIIAISPKGNKFTVSYPKYLMELHLNRYLKNNETIDHKDEDFTNNDINNLQILTKSVHSKLDIKKIQS